MTDSQKINAILRHTDFVYANTRLLGHKLLEFHKIPFDLKREDIMHLFYLGKNHDSDKLLGFVFEHLWKGDPLFKNALALHHQVSQHHPEFWPGGVKEMPTIYVAEMVCDCLGRAQEFGTDIKRWFWVTAMDKYEYDITTEFADKVKFFLDLILTPKF